MTIAASRKSTSTTSPHAPVSMTPSSASAGLRRLPPRRAAGSSQSSVCPRLFNNAPREDDSVRCMRTQTSEGSRAPGMSRVEKPYVLLADDNEATCTLLTALLHRDFNVEAAFDGRETIERLRTRRYDA